MASERRIQSPVQAPAVKRKKSIHVEELDMKMIIVGEPTDDEDGGIDIYPIGAKQ